MEKKMIVNGLKCPKCEARAVKALEAIEGVDKAVASHTENNAIVTLSKDVADDILKKAVEDAGYEVAEIN